MIRISLHHMPILWNKNAPKQQLLLAALDLETQTSGPFVVLVTAQLSLWFQWQWEHVGGGNTGFRY